jgi:transposase-like protein
MSRQSQLALPYNPGGWVRPRTVVAHQRNTVSKDQPPQAPCVARMALRALHVLHHPFPPSVGDAACRLVRDVARQADVTSSLIYRWRRDLQAAANGFARVLMAPAGDGITAPPPLPAIEIEFDGNARARIPASVPPALAAAVVEALARR